MDLKFLAEADATALQLEKAKHALEGAKAEMEAAKKAYDELLARSEEQGIPRAKLKKLTDDRLLSLFESGVLDFAAAAPKEPRPKRPKAVKPEASEGHETPAQEGPAL